MSPLAEADTHTKFLLTFEWELMKYADPVEKKKKKVKKFYILGQGFVLTFFICNIRTSINLVQTNTLPFRTYCSPYHSLLHDLHFFTGTYKLELMFH